MVAINSILNVAGLLLWLGWRDLVTGSLLKNPRTPLARTLRHTAPSNFERWKYLGGLAVLLLLRAVIYWWLGATVNWTPRLYLGLVAPPFRTELFGQMVLLSLASFAVTLAEFYLSLLLLALVNHRVTEGDPVQKFVREHLGVVARWPFAAKLILPFAAMVALWLAAHPLLVYWEILPRVASTGVLVKQGLLLGAVACLIWKYTIAGLLLLHFLNSYVYFGNQPLWNFVNATSRRMLSPLRWLPLKFGRMDFAPIVGIALVFLLAEFAHHWLPRFYPA